MDWQNLQRVAARSQPVAVPIETVEHMDFRVLKPVLAWRMKAARTLQMITYKGRTQVDSDTRPFNAVSFQSQHMCRE